AGSAAAVGPGQVIALVLLAVGGFAAFRAWRRGSLGVRGLALAGVVLMMAVAVVSRWKPGELIFRPMTTPR
ncbi:MAG: hypothetical protein GY953_12560, partial [bacterium]|nr:hypothetical protein [bacterium]